MKHAAGNPGQGMSSDARVNEYEEANHYGNGLTNFAATWPRWAGSIAIVQMAHAA
jgi:hypothetical protein